MDVRVNFIYAVMTTALVSSVVTAQQGPVDATIDKAVATYAKTRTSRGTFDQAITNPLTGSTVKANGEFEQQREPARFSFRFLQPKGDVIVGDGKWLWVYLPSSQPNQVIKVPMTDGGAGSLDLASRFFDSPRSRFTITDGGTTTIAGRATHALVLKPKSNTEPFTQAKVWIDVADGTLRQFETVEPSGITRLVTVTSVTPNVPVDAKRFSFKPPKGTRVVDQTALGGR
jgi:outer membrane lipoprotein carrier protein